MCMSNLRAVVAWWLHTSRRRHDCVLGKRTTRGCNVKQYLSSSDPAGTGLMPGVQTVVNC